MKVKEQYANSINITASGPDVIFSYYKETPEIENEESHRELVSRVRVSLPVAFATMGILQEMLTQVYQVEAEETHDTVA